MNGRVLMAGRKWIMLSLYCPELRNNKRPPVVYISILMLEMRKVKHNEIKPYKGEIPMRKAALFAALVMMVFGFAGMSHANPDTFADAKAFAAELDKPLLLEFYTDW